MKALKINQAAALTLSGNPNQPNQDKPIYCYNANPKNRSHNITSPRNSSWMSLENNKKLMISRHKILESRRERLANWIIT